ncbi:MAG: hypothetical protein JJT85_07620 [Chromatiales bacterium]|nr:hypothetical protein [Chromatiales bacterium]
MFKRISFVLADGVGGLMPAISFWAIVAIFLGSFTVHHLPRIGLNTLRVAVPLAVVAYYLLWRAMYPLSAALDASKDRTPEVQAFTISPLFPASTFELFWFTGLLVFLPFFLVSLLLPWACNQLQAERRHLGLAYGLNTLMFCIGLLSFTLFAPMLSIFYSLKLVFVLLASGVLLLWLLPTSRPPAAWRPALAGAVLLAGVFLVPRDFDPAMMRPDTPPTRYPVEYVMSDGANTTFVVREPGNHRLFFGNLSMSGTNLLAQAYMRLMAHVPLLLQENPERALLICFGVGNTASAIASHPGIRQLDIVDLNRNVFLTAPAFSATHGDVQADPRVRLINDDGRNFLRLTDEVYDLVTSEPPPPMAPGVYRLYSREYYQAIRERLTPSGMMSQWLPVYQMPMEAVALAISTFIDVFPDALLYVGIQNELLLIGGRGEIDLERLARRFGESPAVIADLRSIGVREVEHLLVRIMAGDRELQQRYAGRRVLSDQHNQLDQLMLRPDNLALLPYDPFAVIDYVRGQSPGLAERIAPLVTHLGRLRHRVSSFPVQRVSQDPRIALAGTDWTQLALLQRTAARQQRSGDIRGSIETAREALALAPEYPGLLEWVANGFEQLGMPAESLPYLDRLVAIEPDDPVTRWRLANAFYANAQAAAGVPHLEQALRLAPDWTPALTNLAWLLAVHPDPAVRDPARAEQLSLRIIAQGGEGDVTGRYTLAAAQAAAGRFAEAERTAADALARAEAAGNEALADLLRAQLARYRRGEPATDPRMQRAATD